MSAVFTLNPAIRFALPSLAAFMNGGNRQASAACAAGKPSGLACTDIADAAARATAKGGLRVRPVALIKLYP
jgi:hypothetical protein